MMPRPTSRARLECGIRLNINRLVQAGAIRSGAHIESRTTWSDSYYGELTAIMEAKISGTEEGLFRIQIEEIGVDQRINLVSRPRNFGGWQWYFICPYMKRRVSVLWMPPGARYFACRQRWGRSVAYVSQCLGPEDRAHRGQTKITSRLCRISGADPDDWDFPPKPKRMWWRTYNRLLEKFDRYEEVSEAEWWRRLAKLARR
jgi:hypothetical protein